MQNRIKMGGRKHLRTEQCSYSDNSYYEVEFTCESRLGLPENRSELWQRLQNAITKWCPPSHFGGCGSSWTLKEIHLEGPNGGKYVMMHYGGIGD
jgi:hypothetical protein